MEITVCIGSSCHLKGSREVVTKLEYLISNAHLGDKLKLNGCFCTGECAKGVCVKIDGELYSVSPENTERFFEDEVLGRLK